MRRAVGRASPVAAATAASDMAGWRGWNARITSRPRASASMKSGLVSRRAMGRLSAAIGIAAPTVAS